MTARLALACHLHPGDIVHHDHAERTVADVDRLAPREVRVTYTDGTGTVHDWKGTVRRHRPGATERAPA